MGANKRVNRLANRRAFSTNLSQVAAQIDGLDREEGFSSPAILKLDGTPRENVISLQEFSRRNYEHAESLA